VVRRSIRKSVDRSLSSKYRRVAEGFREAAEVANEYEYWNAAGVLIVHAAIAFADAIAIRIGGVKCQGENHHETVALLQELVAPSDEAGKAFNHLRAIIDHKTSVSYGGELYEKSDVDRLWKHMTRFLEWAKVLLDA